MHKYFYPCFQMGLALAFGEYNYNSPPGLTSHDGKASALARESRIKLQKLLATSEQQAATRWELESATIARRMVTVWLDELLMTSPWLGQQNWLRRPLQSEWGEGRTGGLWFFRQLENLTPTHPDDRQLGAVALRCLSLGFTGCYGRTPEKVCKIRNMLQKNLATTADNPIFPPPLPAVKLRNKFPINATSRCLLLGLTIGLGLLWLIGDIHLNYRLAKLHRQAPVATTASPIQQFSTLKGQFKTPGSPNLGSWFSPAAATHNPDHRDL